MKKLILTFLLAVLTSAGFTQSVDVPALRSDSLGSQLHRREAIMNGNNIRTLIYNNGELAQWPYGPSLEWPKGSGINYLDGFCFVVTALVDSVQNLRDRKKFSKITPAQTYYREEMDRGSGLPLNLANEPWGFAPVKGYSNPSSSTFSFSNNSSSWPSVWPAALGLAESKNGTWVSGTFPFSVQPDLEGFYVMDDSKDAEWTRYPNPFYPILADTPAIFTDPKQWYNPKIRKGLALRVESRLFQWNLTGLEDALFGTHDVINLSDRDYDTASVGFYIDSGLGGDNDNGDDNAALLKEVNAVMFYDFDGLVSGKPNVKLGVFAVVLLDSPGSSTNGIDDDSDGFTDESQFDGIDNDGDWLLIRDDLGEDGLAGTGDPGEGDGIPTNGEPNFELTDPEENDQNGLRSIAIEKLDGKTENDMWPKNDNGMFIRMTNLSPDTLVKKSNIQVLVSTGSFIFKKGIRNRISYALVMANTKEELIEKIKTAQYFYNSGYRYKTVADDVEETEKMTSFTLNQNYPNPFNPTTTITYSLGKAATSSLVLYNQLGQKIRVLDSGNKPAGQHSVTANLENLPSGIYFYSLESEGFRQTRKLVLLK